MPALLRIEAGPKPFWSYINQGFQVNRILMIQATYMNAPQNMRPHRYTQRTSTKGYPNRKGNLSLDGSVAEIGRHIWDSKGIRRSKHATRSQ